MTAFVKCPFCAGHEAVSPEAASIIREAIALHLHRWRSTLAEPTVGELENICNAIDNTADREAMEPAPWEDGRPICPTPDKAKYGDANHAAPNAAKYKQHPYQCECGYWHLSKQTAVAHQAKVNTPAADADEFDAIDPLLT